MTGKKCCGSGLGVKVKWKEMRYLCRRTQLCTVRRPVVYDLSSMSGTSASWRPQPRTQGASAGPCWYHRRWGRSSPGSSAAVAAGVVAAVLGPAAAGTLPVVVVDSQHWATFLDFSPAGSPREDKVTKFKTGHQIHVSIHPNTSINYFYKISWVRDGMHRDLICQLRKWIWVNFIHVNALRWGRQ